MTLPIPEVALDDDIAILGRKGRGKTTVAKGIVERLLDRGEAPLILDPVSVWHGLRTLADGRTAGYPIAIFGGDRAPIADLPLREDMGRAIARLIAREKLPAILDFGGMLPAQQNRLVGDLLDELWALLDRPLPIVLEEAHHFAPQNPIGESSTRVQGQVHRIATMGRSRGFRLISVSQRASRLHKDVLNQMATLVALGVTAPLDRDAVKSWIAGNGDADRAREVYESLAGLKVGEGWVWATEAGTVERVTFPPIKTLDTSATPKTGAKKGPMRTLADVDVSEIRAALETPEPGSSQKSSAASFAVTGKAGDTEKAERDAWARGMTQGLRQGGEFFSALLLDVRDKARELLEVAEHGAELARSGRWALPNGAVHAPALAHEEASPEPAAETPPLNGEVGDSAIRLLDVLVRSHPQRLSARLWATFAGASAKGGWWNSQVKHLRDAGYITSAEGGYAATIAGIGASNEAPGGSDGSGRGIEDELALWRLWRVEIAADIGPAGIQLLLVLAAHRRYILTASQLGLLAGRATTGGWWNAAIASLKAWDVIIANRGCFAITAKGMALLGPHAPQEAVTTWELRNARIDKLSAGALRLYEAFGGDRVNKEQLAKRAGLSPKGGYWNAAWKELRQSGLVAVVGDTIESCDEELVLA